MREIRRFIRFAYNGSPAYGLLTNNAVEELKGPPFQSVEPTTRAIAGMSRKNRGSFVMVAGRPAPSDSPVVFAKFPTSLIPRRCRLHRDAWPDAAGAKRQCDRGRH